VRESMMAMKEKRPGNFTDLAALKYFNESGIYPNFHMRSPL
jgi:hypothetical protein